MFGQNTSSDSQIIKQVLSGQHEAFGILVERYMPVAHAMAFAHTHNHADAQDVVRTGTLLVDPTDVAESAHDERDTYTIRSATWAVTDIGGRDGYLRCLRGGRAPADPVNALQYSRQS